MLAPCASWQRRQKQQSVNDHRAGRLWALARNAIPCQQSLCQRPQGVVTRFLCEGARAACETLYARVRAHGQAPGDAPLAVVPE